MKKAFVNSVSFFICLLCKTNLQSQYINSFTCLNNAETANNVVSAKT